jgi:DNA-binding LacI/PurR family transcriptional regulator
MIERGHQRIAHVSGPMDFLHSQRRQLAWADTLTAAGLEPGPLVVSDFTAAGGRAATEQLIDLAQPPTAILFANDLMAIAGLSVTHDRGLRVPDDLSIAGFGGSELSAFIHPSLTTAISDPFGWGNAAASVLLEAVGGLESIDDVALPALDISVRGSIAASPRPN